MSRKNLEIRLSQLVKPFTEPNIDFEQYQTPPRVAANLLHLAWTRDDIEGKHVVDLCAGTGILGIGAALLGADVTLVEKDPDAFSQLQQNLEALDVGVTVTAVNEDVLSWHSDDTFDTAILNPPFGIQQKSVRDMDFIRRAAPIAEVIYSIHDGSPKNQRRLPGLFKKYQLKIIESYLEEFPLDRSYPWHSMKRKIHEVLIIHSARL